MASKSAMEPKPKVATRCIDHVTPSRDEEQWRHLYKICNRVSRIFCNRFHLLISLQFAADAYIFNGPLEIAARSDGRDSSEGLSGAREFG